LFPLISLLFLTAERHGLAERSRDHAPESWFPAMVRWRAPLPSGPSASAVASSDQIVIPLRAGRIVTLARVTGLERWSAPIATSLTPAVGNDLVFVAAQEGLIALDAADGTERWRLAVGPLSAEPAWRDGWLVAGLAGGDVVAIRAADGTLLWRRQLGRLSAAPTIDGDRLFLSLDAGRVTAAALADGEERWTRLLGSAPGRVLADGDRLFIGARDNFFYCLDARNGALRWRWRTGADVVGPAALDAERVYFVSLDNVLRALDRSNGAQRWRRPLPMRAFEGPQYVDGRLIVSGLSPNVLMFAPRDGTPAGEWTAPAELAAPVVLFDDRSDVKLLAIAGAVSGDWMVLAVGPTSEPALEPLSAVPGTPLPPERLPTLP
jgi:outer membrane protein assembly factor BamB